MFILSEKDRSLEMEAKKFKGYTIAETGESVDVEYGVGKSTYNIRRMDKMIITSPDGRQIGPVASMAEAKREINRDIDIKGLSKICARHIFMIPDSDINETTKSIIFERCVFIMKERGASASVWCYLFKKTNGRTEVRRKEIVGIADKIMQSLDKMYEAVPERDPLVYGIEGQEISWSKASPVEVQ